MDWEPKEIEFIHLLADAKERDHPKCLKADVEGILGIEHNEYVRLANRLQENGIATIALGYTKVMGTEAAVNESRRLKRAPDHVKNWITRARANRPLAAVILAVIVLGALVGLIGGILGILAFAR